MIIDDLVRGVPAIRHAVLLSPDGLVLDHSADLAPTDAEYLASMAAMLSSLAQRAGALLDGGRTQHLLVRCDNTTLLLVPAGPANRLALTTPADTDPADVLHQLPSTS